MPLEQNPLTGELFLRLPEPHSNIILTPPRPRRQPAPQPDAGVDENHDNDHHDSDVDNDDDVNVAINGLNDPRVYSFLEGPPLPYLREHAEDFIRRSDEDCRRILSMLNLSRQDRDQDQDGGSPPFADGCPFRCIREVIVPTEDDGTGFKKDVLIGDITLVRYPFYEIPPDRSEERVQARERNKALPPGHPDLIWGVGCKYLPKP